MDKDTRKILKVAQDQGFTVEITRKGHAVVRKDGRVITTASGTASDHRARLNLIAQLRRGGFQWPPPR